MSFGINLVLAGLHTELFAGVEKYPVPIFLLATPTFNSLCC